MSFLTHWRRQSAAEKALVLQEKTIADVADVNQAAITEIASLHAYTAQKVAEALAIASSLGVDINDTDDTRRFWLSYFIDHTTRAVQGAEEEIRLVTIAFARISKDTVRWNLKPCYK